jgi:ribonucleoside-triphosphate reductase
MVELPSVYQSIIHKSRYSRFLEEENRRESWEETVGRLVNYIETKLPKGNEDMQWDEVLEELQTSILNLEVMPSMRLLMTAGEAVERDNIAAFNCSYLAINNKRAFSEALYILMNGTGVGFSCERQEINKLPTVPENFKEVDDVIVVGDSKLGWAKAYRKLISSLWEGDVPVVDYSRVRAAGARLKTFGGRASGPEPLKRLFDFTRDTLLSARGRKLNSLEVHDIMCMIGEIVVVGGVRRSALISLSNLTDRRMREAKMGAWYVDNSHRGLANNSVAYTEKPDSETFMEEWLSLVKSKSGERGIFNRVAAEEQASKWGRRNTKFEIELEDGTVKTYYSQDKVKTKGGEKYVYQLTESDEIL